MRSLGIAQARVRDPGAADHRKHQPIVALCPLHVTDQGRYHVLGPGGFFPCILQRLSILALRRKHWDVRGQIRRERYGLAHLM